MIEFSIQRGFYEFWDWTKKRQRSLIGSWFVEKVKHQGKIVPLGFLRAFELTDKHTNYNEPIGFIGIGLRPMKDKGRFYLWASIASPDDDSGAIIYYFDQEEDKARVIGEIKAALHSIPCRQPNLYAILRQLQSIYPGDIDI